MESTRTPFKTQKKVAGTDEICYALQTEDEEASQQAAGNSEVEGSNKSQKTEHACIVEAHESTRKRSESTLTIKSKDHIMQRGFNSLSHSTWFTSLFLCLKRLKKSGCESSSGQRMEEGRKVASVAIDQCEAQKKVILQAQREKKQVHFAALMDICQLKNAELEPKYRKYRAGSCSEVSS